MGKQLRVSRREYRSLAEVTKQHGLGLTLSTFDKMRCWGFYSGWAELVCMDAAAEDPGWDERGVVTLAATIDTEALRSAGAGRPELDWGQLEDHEIIPFIVWHEIGHCMDNFSGWDIITLQDIDIRDECRRRSRFINEVLADRYAWQHVRPGEPIPLSEYGKRQQERTAEGIAYLSEHVPPRTNCRKPRPLRPGQYCDVPDEMLATPERAAFIGPRVNRRLIEQAQQRHPSLFREAA